MEDKLAYVKEIVDERLPKFKEICETAKREGAVVLMHQDAYAADYQPEEFMLLGMAIKYAGSYGLELRIIGTNRETLAP